MNIHRTFLGFFLAIGIVGLITQTFNFLKLALEAGATITDVPNLFQVWFHGLDIVSLFGSVHIVGAYPALLVISVAVIGLKVTK